MAARLLDGGEVLDLLHERFCPGFDLLGLAIGEVYARCAATGERPRELLLAEQLQRRYELERGEGSVGIAEALLSICEHVKGRIEAARGVHLAGDGPAHAWAGRSFLVIDEAWHLIQRPATGRWFNEFVRRSRHK